MFTSLYPTHGPTSLYQKIQQVGLTLALVLIPMVAKSETAAILMTAELLSKSIEQPNLVVLDIRDEEPFAKEHIAGARRIDTNAWRAKTHEPNGLNEKEFWSEELGKLGLTQEQTIVIIGGPIPESARMWWLLRYLGLKNVQLLDGGHKAWVAAGLPVVSNADDSSAIQVTEPVIEFQENLIARLDDVSPDSLADSNCKIIDNRSDGEYTGTRGIGARTGHIPDAIHLEWQKFVDEDGKFLPAESIRKTLAEAQIELDQPLITHCQSGGRSSVAALALELAGAKSVKNFYGGWSVYGDAVTLPVEKSEIQSKPEKVEE